MCSKLKTISILSKDLTSFVPENLTHERERFTQYPKSHLPPPRNESLNLPGYSILSGQSFHKCSRRTLEKKKQHKKKKTDFETSIINQ